MNGMCNENFRVFLPIIEQHSFQTQLRGNNKETPLVFVILVVMAFKKEFTLLQQNELPSFREEQISYSLFSEKIPISKWGSQKFRLLL
jgi:hypothetical protein